MLVLKRLLFALFLLSFVLPSNAEALLIAPFFDVIVNKTTIGEDGSFSFHVKGYSGPFPYFSQDSTIQTTSGFGTFTAYSNAGSNDKYYITEDLPAGWVLASASCTSGGVGVSYQTIPNGVLVTAQPFSTVTCNFVNAKQAEQTPVLIVPGVIGTDLQLNNEKLWLNLGKMATDIGDDFMDSLVFNNDLTPVESDVYFTNIIRKQTFGPIAFDYTQGLIQEFTNQGYVEGSGADATLFTFPYDWRYGVSGKDTNGVVVNKEALRQKIQSIMSQTGATKVDVVAHSTGGLLVKKYVMDTQDHHIGKAVFVGVPNTGAPKAVKVLLTGDNFGIPWLEDAEMKKIGQNLPVLYDLAPSVLYDARKGSFLKTIDQKFLAKDVVKDLNYTDAWALMTSERGANASALLGAEILHTTNFDDFDMRTAGVDVYNIVGCKAGTVGQVVERRTPTLFGSPVISYDVPVETPGDGTVPLESATNVPVDVTHKYYALKAEHGKMMSQDGARQQIVNIVAGSSLSTPHITQDISGCKLNGKAHAIFSPLDVEVVDQDGNRLGKREDGSLQNDIPNADFSIYGEHKFLYLPDDEGQTYTFHLKGTGNGTFTYKVQNLQDNNVVETEVFSQVPVTTSLTGGLGVAGGQTTLVLDNNGDGAVDETVLPTSTLNASQSKDFTAPVTEAGVIGAEGQAGYYRSSVSVELDALDPVVDGVPEETSGVLGTYYKLDQDMSYKTYTDPIDVTKEGQHAIHFYSADKAGNAEAVKALEFTIDKTAPEVAMQFSPLAHDLVFTGLDNTVVVEDGDDVITLTDQAGNITKLELKEKNRKQKYKAEIASLAYNNIPQDISRTVLKFAWEHTKQGQLKTLKQHTRSKREFNIDAVYTFSKNQTKLEGKDVAGKIHKILPGLTLLKVSTIKGDFIWWY